MLALAELLLVFGLLFWFGFSQLRALDRSKREHDKRAPDHSSSPKRDE